MAKSKTRCGYCYQEGHNRLKCPKMVENANNGDVWAKDALARSSVKKCSYCRATDHNSASCDQKFKDELEISMGEWAVCLAGIRIIERLKIGPGSLIFGPLMLGYECYAYDRDYDGKPITAYETVNYVVEEIYLSCHGMATEKPQSIRVNTLSEPTNTRIKFNLMASLPGIIEEIDCSDKKFDAGIKRWKDRYLRYDNPRKVLARCNETELFQVLHEAPEEEVAKVVSKAMATKPEIVDFTNRKEYQSFLRKKAKAQKLELEEI